MLLVEAGYAVTIVDSLRNSSRKVLARIAEITGKPEAVTFEEVRGVPPAPRAPPSRHRAARPPPPPPQADLRDRAALARIFAAAAPVAGVIHFAAMKAVGESRAIPLTYYDNNLGGTLCLLEAMAAAGCKTLVFSSSCTVYGDTAAPPLDETSPLGTPTNAYAATKSMTEFMLRDIARADAEWQVTLLRYFNPVGAHASGRIGEDPRGVPNCLMPYVVQVLVGRLEKLTVFGDDYATRDGTAVRDYIHVVDVARGHLDALAWMDREAAARAAAGKPRGALDVFNFGTGTGSSVLELIAAMEAASGKKVAYTVGPRRAGDLPEAFACIDKARAVLGWEPRFTLLDSCRDAWRWQSANPMGYDAPDAPAE